MAGFNPAQARDQIGRWTSDARQAAGLTRPAAEQALVDRLAEMDQFALGRSAESVVLKKGQGYAPQLKPAYIPQGEIKGCFENAAKLAMERPELTYVEGFAFPDFIDLPIHHAWVVDKAGNVIDNTWDSIGRAYVGIPFSTKQLVSMLEKKMTYGILFHDNEWFRDLMRNK